MKVLFILYLEGFGRPLPKQEKSLFETSTSKRIWEKVFEKLGYQEFEIIILPKDPGDNIKYFLKTINRKFSSKAKSNTIFQTIITGDHDEKSDNVLKKREEFAKKIKEFLDDKNCSIVLERRSDFKLEKLMSSIVNTRINKRVLNLKIGKENPNLIELFSIIDITSEKKIIEQIVTAIKDNEQTNLILKKIRELSLKK